jgi:TPR repeat protein
MVVRRLSALATVALAACGSPPAAAPRASATMTLAEIARRSNPSVVLVESATTNGVAHGTGFVVARDGRIATNLHVVEGAFEISVTFPDKRRYVVRDLWLPSDERDLAVLRIEANDLVPLPLGDGSTVRAGAHVIAIGSARGVDHIVSDGRVGTTRPLPDAPSLQFSAPVAPGSSGGPLLNDRGEVVGIATILPKERAQNTSFAVPSSDLAALLSKSATPLSMAEFRATGMLAVAAAPPTCDPSANPPNAAACEALCNRRDAVACSELASMLHHGRGVTRDDAKAAELYKLACDGGSAVDCASLGSLYRLGEGVARDYPRALSLLQPACQRGEPNACRTLGVMHRLGEGVPASAPRASQLFERACDAGSPDACIDAGEVLERAKKLDRAATFFQRACDQGAARACTKLGTLAAEGRGEGRTRRAHDRR